MNFTLTTSCVPTISLSKFSLFYVFYVMPFVHLHYAEHIPTNPIILILISFSLFELKTLINTQGLSFP